MSFTATVRATPSLASIRPKYTSAMPPLPIRRISS
jgi:hypothetical protein